MLKSSNKGYFTSEFSLFLYKKNFQHQHFVVERGTWHNKPYFASVKQHPIETGSSKVNCSRFIPFQISNDNELNGCLKAFLKVLSLTLYNLFNQLRHRNYVFYCSFLIHHKSSSTRFPGINNPWMPGVLHSSVTCRIDSGRRNSKRKS